MENKKYELTDAVVAVKSLEAVMQKVVEDVKKGLIISHDAIGGVGEQFEKVVYAFEFVSEQVEQVKQELAERDEDWARKLKQLEDRVILSEDNANRSGRPPLTEEQVMRIVEARLAGERMRKIAEENDVSVGAVHKYVNKHKDSGGMAKSNAFADVRNKKNN